jgi:hypothetical protein
LSALISSSVFNMGTAKQRHSRCQPVNLITPMDSTLQRNWVALQKRNY